MKIWLRWILSIGLVVVLQGCEIKTTPDFKFTGSGSLELDGATTMSPLPKPT